MQSSELLKILKKTGAMLDGHFLLTSGKHSNVYIEKFRILEKPNILDVVCRAMADIVKEKDGDFIIGAAIGGILISGGVGRHLGIRHIFSERINGTMELRRGFKIRKGQKAIIVEDIITTGGSVFELIQLVNKFEADILHIVNLVDRSSDVINFGIPSTALLYLPSESWQTDTCPLCKQGIPITERGRTGKKMEII